MKKLHLKKNSICYILAVAAMQLFCISANAQIVYTDVKPDSVIKGSYNLDLDNDGITDFTFQQSTAVLTCGRTQVFKSYVSIMAANGNNAVINDGAGYALA